MTHYKLTNSQKNILNACRFHGKNYPNVGGVLLYQGSLDIILMKQSINIFLEKNSSVRIRLSKNSGEDTVYITDYAYYEAEYVDLSENEDRDDIINGMLAVPFNMEGENLIEFKILQYDRKRMGFFLRMHHMLADGFAVGLLVSQFIEIYDALTQSRESNIIESTFMDFASLEAAYRASRHYESDQRFWEERLDSGYSRIGRDTEAMDSKRITLKIKKERTLELKGICNANQITLPVFFKAVLLLYLARTTGTSRPSLAVSALGRTQKSKSYIGSFALSLPLAVSIEAGCTFQDLCDAIKAESFKIYKHQQYPQLHSGTFGLMEALFSFQSQTLENMKGYETKWYSGGFSEAKFFLSVDTRDDSDQLVITVDYREKAFEPGEAELILKRLEYIAKQVMYNLSIPWEKVSILPPEEEKIFWEPMKSNDCPLPEKRLSEYMKDSVQLYPEKTAYLFKNESMTFSCAEKKVNWLAKQLEAQDFKKGDIVALQAERSIAFILTVRAVIKAGCSFMPVEKSAPPERADYMLENSGARLFTIPGDIGEAEYFEDLSRLDEPCYVMYTSGSTGRPKGVAVTQRALLNRIIRMNELDPLISEDVIMHKTSISFDVSVWEIFWGSMFGAATSILPTGDEKLPEQLITCAEKTKVTRLHFVPSMLGVFLKYAVAGSKSLPGVKYVYASGEVLRNIERFQDVFTCAKLCNYYGPTECAIDVTCHEVQDHSGADIPIGRPLGNNHIYILDSREGLCPVGVQGELCIGGIQVAKGYLNNEALTRRFFVDYCGETIYKTGDLAYVNMEGEIMFTGRNDDQVKIHGRRVQLSEIETQMCALDHISIAAVSYRNDCLYGWFVSDRKICVHEFKRRLLKSLPYYMVPEQMFQLEEIPLLSNGKIDRTKLVVPKSNGEQDFDKDMAKEQKDFGGVMTQEQQAFAVAVEKALGEKGIQRKIGPDDNLFEVGLDSLDMITLSLIPELTGISVGDFYANRTIRNILNLKKTAAPLNLLKKTDGKKAVVCVPYAGGSYGAFEAIAERLEAEVYSVEISAFGGDKSYKEMAAVVAEGLKTYESIDVIGYCTGSGLATHIVKALEENGQKVSQLMLFAMTLPPLMNLWGKHFSIWQAVPERMLLRMLNRAHGAEHFFTGDMLGRFRQDTNRFFANMPHRMTGLHAEVVCIYGKYDIFTKGYRRSHKKWERFFGKPVEYVEVNAVNHFFGLDSNVMGSEIMPQRINASPTQP